MSHRPALAGLARCIAAGLLTLATALGAWAAESQPAPAQDPAPVRVGVLQFGTVNWELAVVAEQGLDRRHGVSIAVTPLGSKGAVNVALQGDAVDVIVGDWPWVNRLRAEGQDYTFFPYSLAVGGLYVRPDSGIADLAGLRGARLGIAGGPVDKSWLLLQAYGRTQGLDLARESEPAYAAPPLLNGLMLKGELPAVLNFWHYGARLEAAGMRPLISVRALLDGLGVAEPLPMVGWVFRESWAEANPRAIAGLLAASFEAKALLDGDPDLWARIAPLTKAEDARTLDLLRDGYRAGIPRGLKDNGREAAARVFAVLAREGGRDLVGDATALDPGTFWSGADSARLLPADVRD